MLMLSMAVVLVGAFCLLDLLLTLGVVRRLREHGQHLERLLAAGPGFFVEHDTVPVGEVVGTFKTRTVDGGTVSRDRLSGETLVAFFSPGCETCLDKLPEFVRYAEGLADGPWRVLAVVTGQGEETSTFVSALSPVAPVVVDADEQLTKAFKAAVFPVFCVVDADGKVIASELNLARLPVAVGS
ncbi:TlpA disulfide reductase family protein [Actinomadura fulvescens]|uniref:Redoxin domain-containing protein n=1 Tax=Actinomadura fulvescens TaxID=46160 RepID=A0ABP6CNJ4_9ACTN